MIKSDVIKVKFTNDNQEIEKTLGLMDIDPIRWAVIGVEEESLIVSVSYRI